MARPSNRRGNGPGRSPTGPRSGLLPGGYLLLLLTRRHARVNEESCELCRPLVPAQPRTFVALPPPERTAASRETRSLLRKSIRSCFRSRNLWYHDS